LDMKRTGGHERDQGFAGLEGGVKISGAETIESGKEVGGLPSTDPFRKKEKVNHGGRPGTQSEDAKYTKGET